MRQQFYFPVNTRARQSAKGSIIRHILECSYIYGKKKKFSVTKSKFRNMGRCFCDNDQVTGVREHMG